MKFTTSVGAMIAHAHNHDKFDVTTIYQVTRKNDDAFRPAEHVFNKSTGKLYQGSDAKFVKHIFHNGRGVENGKICCKKCGAGMKYNVHTMSNQKLVKIVIKAQKHELKCKGGTSKNNKGKEKEN